LTILPEDRQQTGFYGQFDSRAAIIASITVCL
jgi:hypothetical protein